MIITRKKGKGKEREAPTQMKFQIFPTGVTLLLVFTVLHHYMYSHAIAPLCKGEAGRCWRSLFHLLAVNNPREA